VSGVAFAAGVLATWRVTHLVAAEDGPWAVIARLRQWAGSGVIGQLMDCFYCLSLWVAFPFAWLVGETWQIRLIAWPALSGGAIVIERLTAQKADPAN
jgi:hypothetical protein